MIKYLGLLGLLVCTLALPSYAGGIRVIGVNLEGVSFEGDASSVYVFGDADGDLDFDDADLELVLAQADAENPLPGTCAFSVPAETFVDVQIQFPPCTVSVMGVDRNLSVFLGPTSPGVPSDEPDNQGNGGILLFEARDGMADGLVLRDFTVDGNKQNLTTQPVQHNGIRIEDITSNELNFGRIENVTVRNTADSNVFLQDATDWTITGNLFSHSGCWDNAGYNLANPGSPLADWTPGGDDPSLAKCGTWGAAQTWPEGSEDYPSIAEVNLQKGRLINGFGLELYTNTHRANVNNNTFTRANKIGAQVIDTASTPFADYPADGAFNNNIATWNGTAGFATVRSQNWTVSNNLITDNQAAWSTGNVGKGIGCSHGGVGNVYDNNTIERMGGIGLDVGCSCGVSKDVTPPLACNVQVTNNTITDTCTIYTADTAGAIDLRTTFWTTGDPLPIGMTVEGNTVTAGHNCPAGLFASRYTDINIDSGDNVIGAGTDYGLFVSNSIDIDVDASDFVGAGTGTGLHLTATTSDCTITGTVTGTWTQDVNNLCASPTLLVNDDPLVTKSDAVWDATVGGYKTTCTIADQAIDGCFGSTATEGWGAIKQVDAEGTEGGKGDTYVVSLDMYAPEGDLNPDLSEGGALKLMRLRVATSLTHPTEPDAHRGYIDSYEARARQDIVGATFGVIKESLTAWWPNGPPVPTPSWTWTATPEPSRLTWHNYEMTVVVDNVSINEGGLAKIELRIDGVLVLTSTPDIVTLFEADDRILPAVYFYTYFNGVPSTDQERWIRNLSVTRTPASQSVGAVEWSRGDGLPQTNPGSPVIDISGVVSDGEMLVSYGACDAGGVVPTPVSSNGNTLTWTEREAGTNDQGVAGSLNTAIWNTGDATTITYTCSSADGAAQILGVSGVTGVDFSSSLGIASADTHAMLGGTASGDGVIIRFFGTENWSTTSQSVVTPPHGAPNSLLTLDNSAGTLTAIFSDYEAMSAGSVGTADLFLQQADRGQLLSIGLLGPGGGGGSGGGADTTPPSVVSGLAATSGDDATSSWTFTENTDDTTEYILQYREVGTTPWTEVTGVTSSPETVTGLTNDTTYEGQIAAEDAANNRSPFSTPTVSFTPTAGGGGGGGAAAPAGQGSDYDVRTFAYSTSPSTINDDISTYLRTPYASLGAPDVESITATPGDSLFFGTHFNASGDPAIVDSSRPLLTIANSNGAGAHRYMRLELCGPTSSQCRDNTQTGGSLNGSVNFVAKTQGNPTNPATSILGLATGDTITAAAGNLNTWYTAGAKLTFQASSSDIKVFSREDGDGNTLFTDEIIGESFLDYSDSRLDIQSIGTHKFSSSGTSLTGAHSFEGDIAAPVIIHNATDAEIDQYMNGGDPYLIWNDDRIISMPNLATLNDVAGHTWTVGNGDRDVTNGTVGLARPSLCSRIVIPRDTTVPIGTCMDDGTTACTSHGQCSKACMLGVLRDNPTIECNEVAQLAGACTSEIEYEFDQSYVCGEFATGDPWVDGNGSDQVTITRIVPDHTTGCESGSSGDCTHGWDVDQPPEHQSFTDDDGYFVRDVPSLPLTVDATSGPRSITKAQKMNLPSTCTNDNCYMDTAVLTVVNTQPAADAFRPSWFGPTKYGTSLAVSDLNMALMPALSPTDCAGYAGSPDDCETSSAQTSTRPTAEDVARYFGSPHTGVNGRNNLIRNQVTPYISQLRIGTDTPEGYHAHRTRLTGAALLRLILNDMDYVNDDTDKLALYRALQYGIDMSGLLENWAADSSLTGDVRIKNVLVPVAFAANLFEDQTLLVPEFTGGSEQDTIKRSPKDGLPKWGYGTDEDTYWGMVVNGSIQSGQCNPGGGGSLWTGDPYGYVDQDWFQSSACNPSDPLPADPGGNHLQGYQFCCGPMAWKGSSMFLNATGFAAPADLEPFVEFQQRWEDSGYFNQPDPCAPPPAGLSGCDPRVSTANCTGYGLTWGPAPGNASDCHVDGSCQCIGHGGDPATDGRFPQQHGLRADRGTWPDAWSNRFWEDYEACIEARTCTGLPPVQP